MGQKFSIAGDSKSFTTIKRAATGSAIAKGEPVLLANTSSAPEFCFAFDNYEATDVQLLVWQGECLRVTAQAANAQIASVHFKATDYVYWDATANKLTNVSTDNTLVGRALETKDYSGGVAEGATLLFMTQLQI